MLLGKLLSVSGLTLDMEAVHVVLQRALAQPDRGVVRKGKHADRQDSAVIAAAFHLGAHIGPFPFVPVGDVTEFRIPFQSLKLTEFTHSPLFAAVSAAQDVSLGVHLELDAAVRTLVKNPVQALCPAFEAAVYALFLLPGIVVILKSLNYPVVDLIHRELP